MALGGDRLTGSTGGNSSTGNRPSRNDRNDSNPYSQYQEAMQEVGLNNMSGNTNATYGDGTTHGNNNPDGVGGLPVRNDNSSSGGGNGSSVPAPAPKPQKPKTLSASETLAQIHREEWEDWKDRFQPRLEDLAQQAQSGELTKADVKRADKSVVSSFDRSEDAQKLRLSRLGLQQDSRQSAASKRMLGLNETATRASVRNNTRIAGQDRDMQILAGGGNIGLGANQ